MILFVWDFHGVLEQGNENACFDISNQVLKDAGFDEKFTSEDSDRLYGLKWHQFFEHILPNESKNKHLELQQACFDYSSDNKDFILKHIKPTDNAIEVLSQIESSGNQQIVISNTRQNDLFWFLETIGIRHFFDDKHIIGVNAHQTHGSKIDALKDYLSDKKFDKIVVIGDSESDLKLGRAVGAITYFYKHPHRNHEQTENADHIIKDLRDILQELKT